MSVKILVGGFVVGRSRGPTFTLQLETRLFPNGSHRVSVVAEDVGGIESTESHEVSPLASRGSSYGVKNVNVVFDNTISNARVLYEFFRPELGQIQQIFALWSTPRTWRVDVGTQDGAIVFRSFSGSGTRVAVDWDGTDAGGMRPNPQLIGYFFYDLGPAAQPPPPGGGSGGPPPSPGGQNTTAPDSEGSDSAPYPSSAREAVLAGLTSYFLKPPPMPPVRTNGVFVPWEEVHGPMPPIEIGISDEERQAILTSLATESATATDAGADSPLAEGQAFALFGPFSLIGTFAVAGQGHHPRVDPFGRYPTPPRIGGNVRMSSDAPFGPWGPLKAPKTVVSECAAEFARMGYSVLATKLDDDVQPEDLAQDPFGLPNIFNRANIGLYVGHTIAARDPETQFIWKQSYVPIYNSASDIMTFVGSSSMNFGSDQLKWMAFFSCNIFRDEFYRTDGIYQQNKSFFALPLNGYLHIMQGYATEMRVHHDFAFSWTLALRRSPLLGQVDQTVIGAWNYACRQTQLFADPDVNIARSVYWPECQGDFIYGYGPQTEPNRDPTDPTEQADLEERDERADAPEP